MAIRVSLLMLLAPKVASVPSSERKKMPTSRKEDSDVAVTWECVSVMGPSERAEQETRVAAAKEALRSIPGVKVKGSYRGHISLIMTPRQAEASKASISSVCHGLFRSHPQVLGRGRADASRRQQGRDTSSGRQTTGGIDQQQAAIAMKLNEVLATEPYLDGTGIKIGILSDSWGALPPPDTPLNCPALNGATVLSELDPSQGDGTDEGRAMGELICFIAPQSQLYFWSAFNGFSDYAAGIKELQKEGCNVIVDDVWYWAEAVYSPDILAQAVEEVKALGAAYFGAAGNQAGAAWEGTAKWIDAEPKPYADYRWHNWGTDTAPNHWLAITLPEALCLQWDEPFFSSAPESGGAKTYIDLWLCFEVPTSEADFFDDKKCFGSTEDNTDNGDPFESLAVDEPVNLYVAVAFWSGDSARSTRLKLYGNTYGVGASAGAMAVGAAWYLQTPGYGVSPAELERFSSWGNQARYLDAEGNSLPPQVLLKPDLVAPDGTETSFFIENADDDPALEFFGTSAAAPHAAAIAALMLQKYPTLTVDQLYTKMRGSTEDMFVDARRSMRTPKPGALPRRPRLSHRHPSLPTISSSGSNANATTDAGVRQADAAPTEGPDRYTGHGFLLANLALTGDPPPPPPVCTPAGPCCVDGAPVPNMCCSDGQPTADGTTCIQAIARVWYTDAPWPEWVPPGAEGEVFSYGREKVWARDCRGSCSSGACRLSERDQARCFD